MRVVIVYSATLKPFVQEDGCVACRVGEDEQYTFIKYVEENESRGDHCLGMWRLKKLSHNAVQHYNARTS